MDKQIQDLQDLINIQATNGNWNYDPYMFGMLQGLICARAILTNEEPEYKEAPTTWIADVEQLEKFNKSGVRL